MKLFYRIIIPVLLMLLCLTGCQKSASPAENEKTPLRIVAAIFPVWDWTQNILGENPAGADLQLLLDNGVDLHSFQPSVEDILTISGCDLFIYVGGESDQWVTDALKQAGSSGPRIIKMIEVIGDAAKEEELTEGMQAEETSGTEDAEYDEHVWLSLRNAAAVCDAIAAELSALDPDNADIYQANTATYKQQLDLMDGAYRRTVEEALYRTLLFGDRFPFRYLTEDYGLDYYAAFSGCSAETEASFETISFLSGKADELGLPAILTIDGSDGRIAETIARNTASKDLPVLTLNSMQSVTAQDIRDGITYLSVMENNLGVLKKALGTEVN